jgi:hypothetical protein
MPQTITETAELVCDKGTAGSQLIVTSQNFCKSGKKLTATEQDKQPVTNIKPFGRCKLKPSSGGYLPCVPSPAAWEKTTALDKINGYKILLECSICPCASGGTISVKAKGHSETLSFESE